MEGEGSPTKAAAAPQPPTSYDTPEEEIIALKAQVQTLRTKMASWKVNVKKQLEDASTKNATLRKELGEMKEQRDAAHAETRLAINNEFKERLELKETEIASLTSRIAAQATSHEEELEAAKSSAAAELENTIGLHRLELDNLKCDLAKEHATKSHTLETKLAEQEAKYDKQYHEVSVLTTKSTTQGKKIQELEAALQEALKKAAAAAAGEEDVDDDADDFGATPQRASGHSPTTPIPSARKDKNAEILTLREELQQSQQDVQHFKREIDSLESKLQAEKKTAQDQHEAVLTSEVQRREEQIQVLQALLKGTQSDTQALHERVTEYRKQVAAAEEKAAKQVSTLTANLVSKMEALTAVEAERDRLLEETTVQKATITELQEEGEIRERTFNEIFASNEHKDVLVSMEAELEVLAQEKDAAQSKLTSLEEELESLKKEHEAALEAMAEREEEAERKEAAIDLKTEKLKQLETKTQQQQQELAALAKSVEGGKKKSKSKLSGAAAVVVSDGEGANKTDREEEEDDGLDGLTRTTGSSSALSYAMAESMIAFQQQYHRILGAKAATASQSFFRKYRQLLPVIIIFTLLSSLVYWWAYGSVSTGVGAGDSSLRRFSEMSEELRALKHEYGVTAMKLERCNCTTKH